MLVSRWRRWRRAAEQRWRRARIQRDEPSEIETKVQPEDFDFYPRTVSKF